MAEEKKNKIPHVVIGLVLANLLIALSIIGIIWAVCDQRNENLDCLIETHCRVTSVKYVPGKEAGRYNLDLAVEYFVTNDTATSGVVEAIIVDGTYDQIKDKVDDREFMKKFNGTCYYYRNRCWKTGLKSPVWRSGVQYEKEDKKDFGECMKTNQSSIIILIVLSVVICDGGLLCICVYSYLKKRLKETQRRSDETEMS